MDSQKKTLLLVTEDNSGEISIFFNNSDQRIRFLDNNTSFIFDSITGESEPIIQHQINDTTQNDEIISIAESSDLEDEVLFENEVSVFQAVDKRNLNAKRHSKNDESTNSCVDTASRTYNSNEQNILNEFEVLNSAAKFKPSEICVDKVNSWQLNQVQNYVNYNESANTIQNNDLNLNEMNGSDFAAEYMNDDVESCSYTRRNITFSAYNSTEQHIVNECEVLNSDTKFEPTEMRVDKLHSLQFKPFQNSVNYTVLNESSNAIQNNEMNETDLAEKYINDDVELISLLSYVESSSEKEDMDMDNASANQNEVNE